MAQAPALVLFAAWAATVVLHVGAMGGKKGAEGMCTVQKDYLQGRGKKGNAKDSEAENPFMKGKIFDSSGRKVLDRGEYKEFKWCGQCKNMMVWRKAWERCWDDVKFCSDKCRKLSKARPAAAPEAAAPSGDAAKGAAESKEDGVCTLDIDAKMGKLALEKTRAEFQKRFVRASDEEHN